MEVITKIRIDMTTGEEIERESYEYEGEIAHCGNGGGGDSYDADYNDRMATISESMFGMSEDAYNTYKYGLGSFEERPILDADGNPVQSIVGYDKKYMPGAEGSGSYQNIPIYQDTTEQIWVSDDPNNTSQAQLEQQMVNANAGLLPMQTEAAGKGINLQMAEMDAASKLIDPQLQLSLDTISDQRTDIAGLRPIKDKLYQETLDGVNVNERMQQAGSDTAQAINRVDQDNAAMSRLRGITPTSGINELDQVKAFAGAKTNARTTAEQENYNRLSSFRGL